MAIALVLMKKDMLRYVWDVRIVRGVVRGLVDHIVLCKVRLVVAWIKRIEIENEDRSIGSEKLREHQNIEGYARCLESERVEWDEGRNVEQMWDQRKRAMLTVQEVYVPQ